MTILNLATFGPGTHLLFWLLFLGLDPEFGIKKTCKLVSSPFGFQDAFDRQGDGDEEELTTLGRSDIVLGGLHDWGFQPDLPANFHHFEAIDVVQDAGYLSRIEKGYYKSFDLTGEAESVHMVAYIPLKFDFEEQLRRGVLEASVDPDVTPWLYRCVSAHSSWKMSWYDEATEFEADRRRKPIKRPANSMALLVDLTIPIFQGRTATFNHNRRFPKFSVRLIFPRNP